MRIWCQSGNPTGLVPTAYAVSLKRHVQEVARPDTVVELHGLETVVQGADRYFSTHHVMGTLITKSAIQAEREGYDAFAVTCTMDPGFFEVREMVDIPVAFILESSLHLACLLAPRCGFVTHNKPMLLHLQHIAKTYGLGEFLTAGESLNLSFEDAHQGIYTEPKRYVDAFVEAARRVIRQGADILLTSGGPLNLFLIDQHVTEVDGVPVLDQYAAVMKIAEMMVDLKELGVTRSKHGLYAGPSGDALTSLRRLYGA
jgi:allantoin racemase